MGDENKTEVVFIIYVVVTLCYGCFVSAYGLSHSPRPQISVSLIHQASVTDRLRTSESINMNFQLGSVL